MKSYIITLFFIIFFFISCTTPEDVLQSEKFIKFYIEYKKELVKNHKEQRVDTDSLLSYFKISQKEYELVKKGVKEDPIIWLHFTEKALHYLDSSIAYTDSIEKAKQDSIRSKIFRYQFPDKWRISRDLYAKNRILLQEYKKLHPEKKDKDKRIKSDKIAEEKALKAKKVYEKQNQNRYNRKRYDRNSKQTGPKRL